MRVLRPPGADPAAPLRVVRAGRDWTITDVDAPPGYAAAVATVARPPARP